MTLGADSTSHRRVDCCNISSLCLATTSYCQIARQHCKMNLDKQHEMELVRMLIFTMLSNSFNFLHFNEEEPFLCELKLDSENCVSGDRYI